MKKVLILALVSAAVLALAACGGSSAPDGGKDGDSGFVWTREGYFIDENGQFLNIFKSEEEAYPGWYVGVMLDEEGMYGWYVPQEGQALRGNLVAEYLEDPPFIVTVTEEGDTGVALTVEDGKTYYFTPYDIPEATIFITVNVEGMGGVDYAQGEETPVFDPEYPYQSAQINLAEPDTYTFLATSYVEGWEFVKWTRNGEDFSTEECITVELTESADFLAVFEQAE